MSDNQKAFNLDAEFSRLVHEFVPSLEATDDKEVIGEAVKAWKSVFYAVWPSQEGLTPEEMAGQFALFLRSLIPVTNVGMVKVRASLGKDYGKVSMRFELEDYAPRTKAGIQAGFDRCLQTVNIQHDRYVNEFVAGAKGQELGDEKNTKPANDVEILPCDRLSIRWENDKPQVRAHGGKFSKFGVPVYQEILDANEIDAETMPAKGMELKNTKMHIQMVGGKPRKVIRLEAD